MFGLGMPEILMILAIALIVIGPKKLPDLAKTLGRAMGEFKRSAQDFKQSIDMETTVKDITDIEGITEETDSKDTTLSELKDEMNSKDLDTDNFKNNSDDKEDIDTPLEDQNSDPDTDSTEQDNNESKDKSDIN
ncbi:twin-arginine translocase TatA/TatE family subunit [Desulfobacterales bacterium HSG17]|nr:twin-arginine translocase TatA/TatE family subunit [Desulfobacterales bacterium HSG17]